MIDKNKIKAVLFDMDGTLTDTEPVGQQVMQSMLSDAGITLTEDEWELFDKVWRRDGTEMSFEEFAKQIAESHNMNQGPEPFCNRFFEEYEKAIAEAPDLPGTTKLLKKIKGKYSIGLVTASTRTQAEAILQKHGWTEYFDAVVTQDEYKVKKPDPAGYLMAAQRLNAAPAECVVIEDSKNGALSGKNASMYVVGVRAGNKHPQDLSAADRVIETLREAQGILM